MQSIAETCVRFDAVHLSINLVSEIALPMFPILSAQGLGTLERCLTGGWALDTYVLRLIRNVVSAHPFSTV